MVKGTYHVWRFIALFWTVLSLIVIPIPIAFTFFSPALILTLISSGFFFLSIFWNIFVIAWEKSRKEVIHPGSVVGMDLVTWLYALVMAVIGWIELAFYASSRARRYSSSSYYYRYYRVDAGEYNGAIACVAIYSSSVTISGIIHFALFVKGCIHEDQRRKNEKNLLAAGGPRNAAVAPAGNHPSEYYGPGGLEAGLASAAKKQALLEQQEAEFGQDRVREKQAEVEMMEANFGESAPAPPPRPRDI